MCFLVHVAVCLSIPLSLFISTSFTFTTNHCEVEAMFCVIMIRTAFYLNISCNYYENKINCKLVRLKSNIGTKNNISKKKLYTM